jgi:hypothetical protein
MKLTIKNLFAANKIAIPLKKQEGLLLNPQPNFLVIENIFDYLEAPFPNDKGEIVNLECRNTFMKLVYREILPAENGKEEAIREILMDDIGNIPIPEDYEFILKNHNRLITHKDILNSFLPLFKFRGVLKGFILQYDDEKSQEYLDFIEAEKNPIVENSVEDDIEQNTEEDAAPL